MSNINKQALREAAEKATPGEWWIDSHGMAMVAHHNDNTMIVFVTDGEQMGKAIRHEDTGNLSHWRNDNDASFIATANPATVLALLDELEAAEKRIAELEVREVVVNLPAYVDGRTLGYGEVNHMIDLCADAIEKAGHAAGIITKVGE